MKISGSETVRRYHVVFSKAESDALRAIGHLPPWSSAEAPLTLTEQELLETAALIQVSPEEYRRIVTEHEALDLQSNESR